MAIDADLLDILVCPKCRATVTLVEEETALACSSPTCGLIYPIRDGIPVMLIDEARPPGDRG
jgi:uncharacterized protein YbaR (Trm112 family)